MRPVIGVLPLFDRESHNFWINPRYMHALEVAGGLPVLLSLTEDRGYWQEACRAFDGFLFTGGPDVEPTLYGHEKIEACGFILPLRDSQELWMLQTLLALGKPILGVCRGVQVLDVAAGGTMYQDLPVQRPYGHDHNQCGKVEFPDPTHPVTVVPGTRLRQILGADALPVNSMHHQAVWDLAPGFVASAYAADGLIEAIERTGDSFALGVQWHPEFLWDRDDRQLALFRALVEASK